MDRPRESKRRESSRGVRNLLDWDEQWTSISTQGLSTWFLCTHTEE